MGVVKYTGPVASFHCPTNAEIRSLKVHFSPKQEGSGDPSPENVRPIVGWDGVSTYHKGKNLLNISDDNIIYENYSWSNNGSYYSINDTTITLYNTEAKSYMICFSALEITEKLVGKQIILSAITTGTGDYGIFRSDLDGTNRSSSLANPYTIVNSDIGRLLGVRIRINGYTGLYTVNNIQLEFGSTPTSYEPYQGSTTNYEFGVLGKNKFDGEYPDIKNSTNLTYRSIYVGNQIVTASSNMPKTTEHNWSNLFILPGQVTSGAGTGVNDFNAEKSRTITPIDGWVTIAYRNAESVDPREYQVQLELGSTATAYEPYDPNHTVYGGWVDLITGEVLVEYEYMTDTWGNWGTVTDIGDGTEIRIKTFSNSVYGDSYLTAKSYCNVAPYSWNNSNGTVHYYISDGADTCRVYLPSNTDTSLQIQVVGKLKTPILLATLAPTQLQTFLGQNNVWSNADYVEVEYDLHETQDILNRKNFIIANQPHIVKPAAAPLQNFVTDVPAPLKECKVHFSPVQEGKGDPSPENVMEITGWTGVEVYQMGKNLFDKDSAVRIEGYTISYSGEPTTSTTSGYLSNFIPVMPNTKYTLTGNGTRVVIYYNATRTFISRPSGQNPPQTFTTPKNCYYIRIQYLLESIDLSTWQLELGSTATEYESYTGITIPITFPSVINILNSTTITANKTLSSAGEETSENSMSLTNYIKVNEGDTYKLTFISKEGPRTRRIYGYNTNKEPVESLASTSWVTVDTIGSIQATIPSGVEYIRVCYKTADENIFLEGPESSVIYGGYVDLVTGEVWKTHEKITVDGVNFAINSGFGIYNDFATAYSSITDQEPSVGKTEAYIRSNFSSNHFKVIFNSWTNPSQEGILFPRTGNNNAVRIYVSTSRLDDISTTAAAKESLQNYIKANPFDIVYPLAVPILLKTFTTTQLKTLRGTNNLWSNSNDNIEIAYWKH